MSNSAMNARVLILGATGFLGANLAATAPASLTVMRQARRQLGVNSGQVQVVPDIEESKRLAGLLDRVRPTAVVNCIALASVDQCERDPERAASLNVEFPALLAQACAQRDVALVHFSTDAVFGGKEGPYFEDDCVSPINEYGRSKARGERAVLEANPLALVVRTNIYGWSPTGNRSLFEFFFNLLSENQRAPGFTDVFFRPISVLDLWPALTGWISDARDCSVGGVRHATGSELISKYEFGCRIAKQFNLDSRLMAAVSIKNAGLKAPRASVLDVHPSPLQSAGDLAPWPPAMSASLAALNQELRNGLREQLALFGPPNIGDAS
jgi:dTDP-4-dehydrorhamnose reductase